LGIWTRLAGKDNLETVFGQGSEVAEVFEKWQLRCIAFVEAIKYVNDTPRSNTHEDSSKDG
jgi:hypothetical protein